MEPISFLHPTTSEAARAHVQSLLDSPALWRSRAFTQKCVAWLEQQYPRHHAFLTPSCSQAMGFGLSLLPPRPKQHEALLPSFTHPALANALLSHGWTLKFIDIEPHTCNIDVKELEKAISSRTGLITCLHYGGFACDLKHLKNLSQSHSIPLLEDNAHGFGAQHGSDKLGTEGRISFLSFEMQKNVHCGEGGALLVPKTHPLPRLRTKYHSGTNRHDYLSKKVAHYEWQAIGNKLNPSELSCAYLLGELQSFAARQAKRKALWQRYHTALLPLSQQGYLLLPRPKPYQKHNAHLFFVRFSSRRHRKRTQDYLSSQHIETHTHYEPLHKSRFGKQFPFFEKDKHTSATAQTLLRLPLHDALSFTQVDRVAETLFQLANST